MPRLSIIVPVYNEEPNLTHFIETFMAVPLPVDRECLFIDDC